MPKLKSETKAQREAEKLADFLGITTEEVTEKLQPYKETPEQRSRQAEAILLFVEDPSKFVQKKCKGCDDPFVTNYKHVAYCSDHCRKKELKRLGLDWLPHKSPEERWARARIPIDYSIPAAALKVLLAIAESQGPVQSEPHDEVQPAPDVLSPPQSEPQEEEAETLETSQEVDTILTSADAVLAELGIA